MKSKLNLAIKKKLRIVWFAQILRINIERMQNRIKIESEKRDRDREQKKRDRPKIVTNIEKSKIE